MRAFRGRPMQPPFFRIPSSIGNEVLHLDDAMYYNWVWEGRGRSVTGVSPRVVAKSKSVYLRSKASHSGMESAEGEGGEAERGRRQWLPRMLRDCIATWECSDCTGARVLHGRARTCTHVHTRWSWECADPYQLAKRSLNSVPFVPILPRDSPSRRVASRCTGLRPRPRPRTSTCVDADETTPLRNCIGVATPGTKPGIASEIRWARAQTLS